MKPGIVNKKIYLPSTLDSQPRWFSGDLKKVVIVHKLNLQNIFEL